MAKIFLNCSEQEAQLENYGFLKEIYHTEFGDLIVFYNTSEELALTYSDGKNCLTIGAVFKLDQETNVTKVKLNTISELDSNVFGNFLVIEWCERSLKVATDPLSTRTIFAGKNSKNEAILTSSLYRQKLNALAKKEFKTLGYILTQQPTKHLRRIGAGEINDVLNSQSQIYFDWSAVQKLSLRESTEVIHKSVGILSETHKLTIPFSSGFDSRLLAKISRKWEPILFTYGNEDGLEVALAKKSAKIMNLRHHVLTVDKKTKLYSWNSLINICASNRRAESTPILSFLYSKHKQMYDIATEGISNQKVLFLSGELGDTFVRHTMLRPPGAMSWLIALAPVIWRRFYMRSFEYWLSKKFRNSQQFDCISNAYSKFKADPFFSDRFKRYTYFNSIVGRGYNIKIGASENQEAFGYSISPFLWPFFIKSCFSYTNADILEFKVLKKLFADGELEKLNKIPNDYGVRCDRLSSNNFFQFIGLVKDKFFQNNYASFIKKPK